MTTLMSSVLVAAILSSTSMVIASEKEGRELKKIKKSTTITRSGAYILTRSLITKKTNPVITITADNVSLDLNGHNISGPGNVLGVALSVDNAQNVRITNGQVSSFNIGIRITDSNNVKIDKIQISGDDLGRVNGASEIGVLILNSRGVDVGHNVISNTGLGVFVRGGGSGANLIHDNTLAAGTTGRLGICYNPAPGLNDGPSGDLIYNNLISGYGIGIQTSPQSRNNVFAENTIAFDTQAIQERTQDSNVFEDNTLVPLK